ncbi:MAG: hypothetical protein CL933_18685 [Deltaproteobacteria bacterium]|nr:hypothetical protein [Deltaproteobacteria bacterium]
MPWLMRGIPVAAESPRTAPGRARGHAALGAWLAIALLGCQADQPTRPDLILITIDTLSTERLACFGGEKEAGRSLCALGNEGTLFAWAAAPGRGESSSASTALTGLAARAHGVADDGQSFLADAHTTIAETLSRAGYRTAAFVASARLNRSRRLDQGFDRYDDRFGRPMHANTRERTEMASSVQSWIASTPSPRFIWIHLGRAAEPVQLDRLLSRLSHTFDDDGRGPGVLFAALRGEDPHGRESPTLRDATIQWSTHRVPLIWRPPPTQNANLPRISLRLASPIDVAATLRTAARVSGELGSDLDEALFEGRDLTHLARSHAGDGEREDRLVLLETSAAGGEVGLASETHLYVRSHSTLDGSGQPVPTAELFDRRARFAALPIYDRLRHPAPRSAALAPGPWREDILDAQSPVPRLEFHLARRLDEPGRSDHPNGEDPR